MMLVLRLSKMNQCLHSGRNGGRIEGIFYILRACWHELDICRNLGPLGRSGDGWRDVSRNGQLLCVVLTPTCCSTTPPTSKCGSTARHPRHPTDFWLSSQPSCPPQAASIHGVSAPTPHPLPSPGGQLLRTLRGRAH